MIWASLPFGDGGLFAPFPFEDAVKTFVQKMAEEDKAQQLVDKLTPLVQKLQTNKDGQVVIN